MKTENVLFAIAAGAILFNRKRPAVGAITTTQPPGMTVCRDGKYSTLPVGPGVCSYHGGAMTTRTRIKKAETAEIVDLIPVTTAAPQAPAVVEVPVVGVYRFSTYTTKTGKTGPSLEVQFNGTPPRDILEALKQTKAFWYNPATKLWTAWDKPTNRELLANLPLALDGEMVPVVPAQTVRQLKKVCSQNKRLDIRQGKVGRNRAKAIFDCIFENATEVQVYSLGNAFIGESLDDAGDYLRQEFETVKSNELIYLGNGVYRLRIHSNLWYEFKSNLATSDAKTTLLRPVFKNDIIQQAVKFEQTADNLEAQIDAKFNPATASQNPTYRRSQIMDSMQRDGERLKKVQVVLRNWAAAARAGTLPEILSGLNSKAAIEQILFWSYPKMYKLNLERILKALRNKRGGASIANEIDQRHYYSGDNYNFSLKNLPYFDAAYKLVGKDAKYDFEIYLQYKRIAAAGLDTETKYNQAREMIKEMAAPAPLDPEVQKKREIEKKIRDLIGTKIPGYHNTPPQVVDMLLDYAKPSDGDKVLEPSAGAGDIADAIKERAPGAKIDVVEINYTLRDILKLKGYNLVGDDFLQYNQGGYTLIVMNPPFESSADIMHVQHAYKLLAPGGRLVSVMSEGPFFRSDKLAVSFRDWLELNNGYSIKVPEGAFLKSRNSTGVNTRIVTMDKPGIGFLRRIFPGIGAIFPAIPENYYECKDGTFTDKSSRRACAWHGGLKTGIPIPTATGASAGPGSVLQIQDVPLSDIKTKPEWFQNRSDAYSSRSVENIVAAVLEGKFVWTNFDPIQLWRAPDGNLYILSGHSRKEAFRRLAELNIGYQGRTFDKIPAKIETSLTLEEAKRVAAESNTLGTPETLLERSDYYRRLRQTGDFTLRELEEAARRTEGRNANTVLALSYLNPNGKTYAGLVALQTADETSRTNLETLARWIGNARKTMPMLSDFHENEIYDWLVKGGGYGTRSGQVNSERDFKNEILKVVQKRTTFGVLPPEEPLNIQNARYTSPVEEEYNRQVDALRNEIAALERDKQAKIKQYAAQATAEQLAKILAETEAGLRRKNQELQRLIAQRFNILDAAKSQASLFGIGKAYPNLENTILSYTINGRYVKKEETVPEIKLRYNRGKTFDGASIRSTQDAANFLRKLINEKIQMQEVFIVLYLNKQNEVIGYNVHSLGSIDATMADTRIIFGVALKALALGIIVCHNHPSGALRPSQADLNLTKRMEETGKLLNVTLLDHVIVTKEGHYSFADNGLIN